uniref:amino acid kinase family protein n=1 Tax=Aeromonas dhakensis TaxID=196024 RepID=UPI001FCACFEC
LMPGFTGGSDKGETVLLGRNGSDYSAAVLAACVDAECCEIWTAVGHQQRFRHNDVQLEAAHPQQFVHEGDGEVLAPA